ncbi:oligosaccharide flippase family protein [Congregibacter variabilis]|uniref:Oligosaccharide flippase family protein n=1 Tax=Congregibacter variabilis TaxID=3081200 RepID=A0ABZ0IB22_9GAMM|nr:oligosaccharide flippase family protein [Congregibacter sp. IMCC43200]
MLIGIYVARCVSPEEFGDYVFVLALATLASVALSLGLPAQLIREVASDRAITHSGFRRHASQVVVFVPAVGCVGALASLFLGSQLFAVGFIFATASSYAGLGYSYFCGASRVIYAGWINTVFRPLAVLLATVGISFYSSDLGPTLVMFCQALGASLAVVLFLFGYKTLGKSSSRKLVELEDPSISRVTYLKAGITLMASQLLINLTTQVDIFLLKFLSTADAVAHFYAASRASIVVAMFYGAAAMLIEPKVARLMASGERGQAQAAIRSTTIAGALMTASCGLFAWLIAPVYFELYGPTYVAGLSALSIQVIGFTLASVAGPGQAVVRALGGEVFLLKSLILVLAINIGVSALLIPRYGPAGAAFGSSLQFVSYGFIMSMYSAEKYGLSTSLLTLVLPGRLNNRENA